ncbi:hypothetical protein GIB67_013203 [Kingdonia uniflora]|uniref:Cytochrome c-type biogenesis protein CcmF C-terminal domain-containing protein n=1 Tax=Kingdonia uniflora TaxID=39325 RepID=A0A7J7NQY6_9MAGN|nr:hypothetical protein GIB67_013203 [Kingdonia uniflora]
MRQKQVPRFPNYELTTSPIGGERLRVWLRSTNAKKIQFTQRLPLGSELHMGKERCSLRGLDHLHGPTSHSICGNLMIYQQHTGGVLTCVQGKLLSLFQSFAFSKHHVGFPATGESQRMPCQSLGHPNFWLTMFPEKRYFLSMRERTSTTEVAIHTNLLTDLYALIGTGSSRAGGWYTTCMKLPFIFCIWIGFLLASSGGSRSLLRQLKSEKLRWN